MFSTLKLNQRRAQRVSFITSVDIDPDPPTNLARDMFQEHYRLEGRLSCTFWANAAQFEQAERNARKMLMYHLYKNATDVLNAIELAANEGDFEQVLLACADMRDVFEGDTK